MLSLRRNPSGRNAIIRGNTLANLCALRCQVHALLEERCLNEVIKERNAVRNHRDRLTDEEVQQEAHKRYQLLCAQLAPMNLVSQGLDHERHGATRQRVREGLDRLQQSAAPRPSFPGPLRRLLTESTSQHMSPLPFDGLTALHQSPVASRYLKDYDELGVLGRGGYGEVSPTTEIAWTLEVCSSMP